MGGERVKGEINMKEKKKKLGLMLYILSVFIFKIFSSTKLKGV